MLNKNVYFQYCKKKSREALFLTVCPVWGIVAALRLSHWVNHCRVATVSHACVTITQWLPLSFCKQNNWATFCFLWKSQPAWARQLSLLMKRKYPKEKGDLRCAWHYFEHFYSGRSCSKTVAPFGGIPLKQLQSLCDCHPSGATFLHYAWPMALRLTL